MTSADETRAIHVSSAVGFGARREGCTWPLGEMCRRCGDGGGGREVGGEAYETKRRKAERVGLGGRTEGVTWSNLKVRDSEFDATVARAYLTRH